MRLHQIQPNTNSNSEVVYVTSFLFSCIVCCPADKPFFILLSTQQITFYSLYLFFGDKGHIQNFPLIFHWLWGRVYSTFSASPTIDPDDHLIHSTKCNHYPLIWATVSLISIYFFRITHLFSSSDPFFDSLSSDCQTSYDLSRTTDSLYSCPTFDCK